MPSLFYLVFSLKLHVFYIIIYDILLEPLTLFLLNRLLRINFEIVLISLYYVIPILVKKFYVLTPGKDNKEIILQNKINSAEKDLIDNEERI